MRLKTLTAAEGHDIFPLYLENNPRGTSPQFHVMLKSTETMEGSPTTLECAVTGDPKPSIKWFKDGTHLHETNRIRSEFDGTTCQLIIFRTEIDDQGEFKCVAQNDFGLDSCTAELLVKELPTGPYFRKKAKNVTTRSGKGVRFSVRLGGNPPPQVNWYLKGSKVEEGHGFVLKEDRRNGQFSLDIEDTNPEDSGTIVCEAFNEGGKVSCEAFLTVLEAAEGSQRRQEEPIGIESVRKEVKLQLEIGGIPTLVTQADEMPLEAECRAETATEDQSPQTTRSISTPSEVKFDGIEFKIDLAGSMQPQVIRRADTNPEGDKAAESTEVAGTEATPGTQRGFTTASEVKDPQTDAAVSAPSEEKLGALEFKIDADGIALPHKGNPTSEDDNPGEELAVPCFVDEGQSHTPFEITADGNVKLKVEVSGNPKPEVRWEGNDVILQQSSHFDIQEEGDVHTLLIRGPIPQDQGTYKCVASNKLGVATRSFNVEIEGPEDFVTPAFEEQGAAPYEITEDGDIKFVVRLLGTLETTVKWMKDGEPLSPTEHIEILQEGNKHLLLVKAATPQDAGQYKCVASSAAGTAVRTFIVDIESAPQSSDTNTQPRDAGRAVSQPEAEIHDGLAVVKISQPLHSEPLSDDQAEGIATL